MIEHATAIGSHSRGKKIWRQLLKDRKQRGHGDTTGHCGPRQATEEGSISLEVAKARTRLAEVSLQR